MIIKTDGIVLREQPTGEQDRLVTLLTRKCGVIRAFANGARNASNRNASATSLLCYSDFSVEKSKKGVYIIKEATAKEVFFALREDIICLSLAQYFAEITCELAVREEDADEFLRLLLNAIYFTAQRKKDLSLLKSAMELRLLSIAGYMPSIVACHSCGRYESEPMRFSFLTGRIYCSDCLPEEKTVDVPLSVVTAMRHICLSETKKLFSFNLSRQSLEILNEMTERYLKSVTMRNYKTLDFYKMMTV